MGPAVPSLWFQQALNALNNGARLYADIKEDGDIGPATLGAFRAYLKARGAEASEVMMKALNSLQGARYIELSRTRAANEDFTFGWLRPRVGMTFPAATSSAPHIGRPYCREKMRQTG